MKQEFSEKPLFVAKSSVNALLRFYMVSSFYITVTFVLLIMWFIYSSEFEVMDTPIGKWISGKAIVTAGIWSVLGVQFVRRLIKSIKRFRLFELSHFMISSRNMRYVQFEEIRIFRLFENQGIIDIPLEKITEKSYMSVFQDYGNIVLATPSVLIKRIDMYMPRNVLDIITECKDTYRYETGTIDNMHLENNMVKSNVMLGSKLDNMATIMENISGQISLEQEKKNKLETKQEENCNQIEIKNKEKNIDFD